MGAVSRAVKVSRGDTFAARPRRNKYRVAILAALLAVASAWAQDAPDKLLGTKDGAYELVEPADAVTAGLPAQSGAGGECLKVNTAEDGFEFGACGSGGGSATALSDAAPKVESGGGDAGTGTEASRGDHVHPRGPSSLPAYSASAAAYLQAKGSSRVWEAGTIAPLYRSSNANQCLQVNQLGTGVSWRDCQSIVYSSSIPKRPTATGEIGTSNTVARGDHRHPEAAFGGNGLTLEYVNAVTFTWRSNAARQVVNIGSGFTPYNATDPIAARMGTWFLIQTARLVSGGSRNINNRAYRIARNIQTDIVGYAELLPDSVGQPTGIRQELRYGTNIITIVIKAPTDDPDDAKWGTLDISQQSTSDDVPDGTITQTRVWQIKDPTGGGGGGSLSDKTPKVESGAGAAGSGTEGSRDDHVHPAAPKELPSFNTTNAGEVLGVRVINNAAALDWGQTLDPSDTAPVALGASAAAGTASEASRQDHVHPTTGLAQLSDTAAVALGSEAGAGSATAGSRQDHVHPMTGLRLLPDPSHIAGGDVLTVEQGIWIAKPPSGGGGGGGSPAPLNGTLLGSATGAWVNGRPADGGFREDVQGNVALFDASGVQPGDIIEWRTSTQTVWSWIHTTDTPDGTLTATNGFVGSTCSGCKTQRITLWPDQAWGVISFQWAANGVRMFRTSTTPLAQQNQNTPSFYQWRAPGGGGGGGSATPLSDGVPKALAAAGDAGAAGTGTAASRGDHVHPRTGLNEVPAVPADAATKQYVLETKEDGSGFEWDNDIEAALQDNATAIGDNVVAIRLVDKPTFASLGQAADQSFQVHGCKAVVPGEQKVICDTHWATAPAPALAARGDALVSHTATAAQWSQGVDINALTASALRQTMQNVNPGPYRYFELTIGWLNTNPDPDIAHIGGGIMGGNPVGTVTVPTVQARWEGSAWLNGAQFHAYIQSNPPNDSGASLAKLFVGGCSFCTGGTHNLTVTVRGIR